MFRGGARLRRGGSVRGHGRSQGPFDRAPSGVSRLRPVAEHRRDGLGQVPTRRSRTRLLGIHIPVPSSDSGRRSLPISFLRAIGQRLRTIARNPSEPTLVRNVAACWDGSARRNLHCLFAQGRLHRPDKDKRADLSHMNVCPENGPDVHLRFWNGNPSDEEIAVLAETSGELRDRRLLRGLTSIAKDSTRRVEVRLGTLIALTQYLFPHSVISVRELMNPTGNPLGTVDHRRLPDGLDPSTDDDLVEIRSLIEGLVASDDELVVRRGTAYLSV